MVWPDAVDQVEGAVVLPERHRLGFRQPDIKTIGQAPLDQGAAHPAEGFEPGLQRLGIDAHHRLVEMHAEARQQLVLGRLAAAIQVDLAQAQAEIGGIGDEAVMQAAPGERRQFRMPGPEARAADDEQQRGQSADAPHIAGASAAEPDAGAARRGAARACLGFPPGLGRDWTGRGWAAGKPRFCTHASHCACSTIQATRSGNGMPRWAACSGTSDRGVMPGWVLISSR